jgi:hypothetical protein
LGDVVVGSGALQGAEPVEKSSCWRAVGGGEGALAGVFCVLAIQWWSAAGGGPGGRSWWEEGTCGVEVQDPQQAVLLIPLA